MGFTIKGALRIAKKITELMLFRFFSFFPINERLILFESEGDFSDNAYALYDYMKRNNYFDRYIAVWLAQHPELKKENVRCVKKWNNRIVSIRRAMYLATAKYIIFDHNYVLLEYFKRNEQVVVDLCHGTPFKAAKIINSRIAEETDVLCAPSEFWIKYSAEFYSGKYNRVLPIGYPRNDYFFSNIPRKEHTYYVNRNWGRYRKVLFWMPTYRKSSTSSFSEEYFQNNTGLPIVKNEEDLQELDTLLKRLNILLVFKIHHLQADANSFNQDFSNISVLKDEEIMKNQIQLYQVVALSDALITDYSSISNDYILLDRPMIFTLDDYEEYQKSRGFSFDNPAQYFAGHHVYNKVELYKAIEEIANGLDPYKEKRHVVLPILNKYQDGNSSQRLVEYLKL